MSGTLTYDDLATFPDDGLRRELLDGELLVSPSPSVRHQRVSRALFKAIDRHLETTGGGELFYAPLDVVLTQKTVLEPDLLLIMDEQARISTEKNIQGAPALVVEVVSDSRVDRVRKRDLYERYGVIEYWIADPEADRIEVLRREGERFSKPQILEPGDTLTTSLLPGLGIDVAAIFARES